MGARSINAKKKTKRRAHKETRAKQLAARIQNSSAPAQPRRASDKR